MTLTTIEAMRLRPVLRAYALAYLASTGPRLIGYLRELRRHDQNLDETLQALLRILRTSAQLHRFPAAAAIIVAGATAVPATIVSILRWLAKRLARPLPTHAVQHRLQYACSFLCAWLAFNLLNKDQAWVRKRAQSRGVATVGPVDVQQVPPGHSQQPALPNYAGKTIDFTLFALCRALDIVVIWAWTRTRSRRWHPEHNMPSLARLAKSVVDPCIFASSASVIMWSWL
jgi:hypothetical protein